MMPLERCGDIMEASSKATKRIHKYLQKHIALGELKSTDRIDNGQLKSLSDWYVKQRSPCLFLHNDLCTIYELRPVACREHLVTGSTVPCNFDKNDHEPRIEVPIRPIRMRDALRLLAADLEGSSHESVLLSCAFDWYRENTERGNRTWPAVTIAERLILIVRAMILGNNTIQTELVTHEAKEVIIQETLNAKIQKFEDLSSTVAQTMGV